jgi:hypothetical protein
MYLREKDPQNLQQEVGKLFWQLIAHQIVPSSQVQVAKK